MEDYIRKPFFYDCVVDDEKIYFPLANYNALCSTNIQSGLTEIIDFFPNEKNEPLLYCGIYRLNNKLLLSPYMGKSGLLLYDLEEKTFSPIDIDIKDKKIINFRGNRVVHYKDDLFVFCFVPVILKINLSNKKIQYIKYPQLNTDKNVIGQITCRDQKVYISCSVRNIIFIFDLQNESFRYEYLANTINGINTIAIDGNNLWMTGKKKEVLMWNTENNTINCFREFPQRFCKIYDIDEGLFSDSILFENQLFLIPLYANMIVKFDIDKTAMEEIFIPDEEEDENSLRKKGRFFYAKYNLVKRVDENLFFISSKTKNIYILNMRSSEITILKTKLIQCKEYQKEILSKDIIREEYFTNGLKDFINVI